MKRLIKLMSIALCLTVVLSTSLVGVFALSMNGVALGSDDSAAATPDEAAAKLYKDESVYVIASADGKVDKIIVSDWIQNRDSAPTITDLSVLHDVENVKGDETYTLNSDNMRVWQTEGKDLYLKGEGKEALPVDLSLTYTLNGAVIAPDQLVGKSGRVTIRFGYKNNTYQDVEIDGHRERIYVPFLMVSGLLLDSERFSNVTVTNGKVISDGERIIVAGFSFPGLSDDLGLQDSSIGVPDFVEITADVKDFALGSTVTIATNGLLNELHPEKLDSLDGLKDSLGQLQDAMTALIDGSSQLYEGLNTLLEKSGELVQGVDALYDGASQLSDGASQLSQGASGLNDGAVQLDLGALDLSNGLSTLTDNNAALTDGSDQTFTSILKTAHDGLTARGLDVPALTPSNYSAVLDGVIDSLSEDKIRDRAEAAAREQVAAAVEQNRPLIESKVTEAVQQNVQAQAEAGVRAQVTAAVLQTLGYSTEDYEAAVAAGLVDGATQAQVSGAIEAKMSSDEIQATVAALVEQNMQSEAVLAAVAQNTEARVQALIEQNMQAEQVQQGIADALAKAKEGAATVKTLKAQLDAYHQFNSGLKTYTAGVASASAGAKQLKAGTASLAGGAGQLKDGAQALSEGAVKLRDGILSLKDGVPALTDGVTKLRDGAMQLSDGLRQFNEQGVSKIVSLLDGELGSLAARLKAAVQVSKDYRSYTGLTDEMDGEVKFIYKTAELSK